MPTVRNALVLAVLVLLGWASGSVVAQGLPPSVEALIANAKKQIKTISLSELKSALDRADAGVLVDVREPGEFASGHIEGAVNIPRGLIEFAIWRYVGYPDRIDLSTKLTLYCKTSGRCALAAKSLQDLGFTNVTSVDMNLDDWTSAGYALVK